MVVDSFDRYQPSTHQSFFSAQPITKPIHRLKPAPHTYPPSPHPLAVLSPLPSSGGGEKREKKRRAAAAKMVKKSKKSKSKRISLRQKHKVLRKVKEHHRKKRKEAKKEGRNHKKKVEKDPGIPNEWPFKEQELKALETRRAQALQELELKKEARKERARKRKLGLLEDEDIANLASAASAQGSKFTEKDAAKESASLGVAKSNDHSERAFYKELVKVIEASDVILEVLDARDPLGSRCIDMEKMVRKADPSKRIVLLLNKIDLVPKESVEKWLTYLREEMPTVAFKCNTQEQRTKLGWKSSKLDKTSNIPQISDCLGAENLIKLLKNYSRSNEVSDPSVTVYKGYSLRKETEEYLAARGLRHSLYSINAADARDELFDDLVPCPFQQPDGTETSTLKRSHGMETGPSKKHPKVAEQEPLPDSYLSCILEFDGACKGNPGKSGAGAIIRRLDGSVIAQLREGLGIATNNAAEYRALILGLKYAAKKGFKYIRAQGDSKLVCNQVQDLWRVRNDNMADLCKKVKALKGMFLSFQISHVLREFNTDADAQANFAVELPVGEIQEQSNFPC